MQQELEKKKIPRRKNCWRIRLNSWRERVEISSGSNTQRGRCLSMYCELCMRFSKPIGAIIARPRLAIGRARLESCQDGRSALVGCSLTLQAHAMLRSAVSAPAGVKIMCRYLLPTSLACTKRKPGLIISFRDTCSYGGHRPRQRFDAPLPPPREDCSLCDHAWRRSLRLTCPSGAPSPCYTGTGKQSGPS